MPNFRAIYPCEFTTSFPPATYTPGHVYELDENLNANFFEETDDPVTVVEEPTDEAPVEPPAPVKPSKGARSAPSPSDDTPAPESTTEPEETV